MKKYTEVKATCNNQGKNVSVPILLCSQYDFHIFKLLTYHLNIFASMPNIALIFNWVIDSHSAKLKREWENKELKATLEILIIQYHWTALLTPCVLNLA